MGRDSRTALRLARDELKSREDVITLDVLAWSLRADGKMNFVVEADIRGFFDRVNHEWLLKFLQQRIGDHRVLRLIGRMLKAGVMEDRLGDDTRPPAP